MYLYKYLLKLYNRAEPVLKCIYIATHSPHKPR